MIEVSRAGRCRRAGQRRAGGLATLAGIALVAAACGGSPAAGPAANQGQERVQQLEVFARCVRSHGVPNFYLSSQAANPSAAASGSALSIMGYYVPGVGPQTPDLAAALRSCKHLLPGGGPPAMTRQQISIMLRFAACMRAHGYPGYPDPQFQNGGVIEQPLPASIDTSSPQFQAAETTCNTAS
jgi:hypothetical protein